MSRDNVTPIGRPRPDSRRQHTQSRIAGRLFSIFDQLCTVTRECREGGEDLDDALLRELGGSDNVANGSPLHDALTAVCNSAVELMRAAEPGEFWPPERRP